MEAPLEIRYAGVVIGRAQEVRSAEGDSPSLFIPVRDPMPVGSVLHLRSGERETPVRVVRAVETTDAAACGMQVRTLGEAEEVVRDFIPPPAVAAEKIKPATPTPVVAVDVAKTRAENTSPSAMDPPSANAEVPVAKPEATAADVTPEVIITVEATPGVQGAAAEPEVAAAEAESKAAEASPVASADSTSDRAADGSSIEVAAVPEAVPVAIGSSMTGALKSATESVAVGEPTPAAPSQPESGVVAEAAPVAEGSAAEPSGESGTTEAPSRASHCRAERPAQDQAAQVEATAAAAGRMLRNLIHPPRLQPGDVVRVIAPSGPLFADAFAAGAAVLSARYQVRYDPATLFARDGFLAGPDDQRLATLVDAVRDPEARAVFMGRGGHGLLRIANRIDPHLLRDHAKPIVGFSDGTILLALAVRAGVAAIHGPVVNQLGRLPEADRSALFSLLESGEPGPLLAGLETLRAGSAQGPLLGGNLEVFSRLLGTPFLPDLDGAILFFEEVGERPYRIDRLLTHLELAGVFAVVAGVVVGDLVACEEPPSSRVPSPSAIAVVRERLGRLSIPVALGARLGHGERNLALPYGVQVGLDAQAGTLVALEAPVC